MTVLIVTEVFKPLCRVLKKKKKWIWCPVRFGAFPSFKRPTCAFEVSFFRDKNRLENIGTCFLLNLHREHRASYAPQIFMRLAFVLTHSDFEIFHSSLAMIRYDLLNIRGFPCSKDDCDRLISNHVAMCTEEVNLLNGINVYVLQVTRPWLRLVVCLLSSPTLKKKSSE